jgi:hypothetical protein
LALAVQVLLLLQLLVVQEQTQFFQLLHQQAVAVAVVMQAEQLQMD